MSISVDIARRVLEASKQRARELRSPVSIAIVDAGGHLVLFERMMAPYGWATGNISLAKANTAVMFNQSTDAVAQWGSSIPGFASSVSAMSEGKFIMAAGGWPIRMNGITIGGIGVSGGNAPGRDDEIARAGLSVMEALAAPIPAQAAPVYVNRNAAPPVPQPQLARGVYNESSPQPQTARDAYNESSPQARPALSTQNLPIIEDDAYNATTSSQTNENQPGDSL